MPLHEDTPPPTPEPGVSEIDESTADVVLQVTLSSDTLDEEIERSHPYGCTLADFKEWAVQEFRLEESRQKLTAVYVCYERDAADGHADGVTVDDREASWSRALEEARRRQPEATSIVVICNAEAERGHRGETLRTRMHFRDLDFSDDAAALSADRAARQRAYQLSYERTRADASLLISSALAKTDMEICVNRTSINQATATDLNYEATNPFDEESTDYGTTLSHDYMEVQDWLTTPKKDFQSVAYAVTELQKVLGDSAEIIRKLPMRRRRNAADPNGTLDGDNHKPHQITGLFWTLYMEHRYGSFILADGCGSGKTHSMIAHLRATTEFWQRKHKPVIRPTLVVCPRTLLEKTYEDIRDQLGIDWKVVKYGKRDGAAIEKVTFDPDHAIYKSTKSGMTVVVCSFQQLQNCSHTTEANVARRGLFARILIDEAQGIRRCDQTRQGEVLKSFHADYRGLFTGSPVVDSIADLDGYLAFLERPEWSEDFDRNSLSNDDGRPSRYSLFRARHLERALLEPPPTHQDEEAWYSDCDSIDGLAKDDVEDKLAAGWRCGHWPALLKINGPRPQSLDRKPKRKRRSQTSADITSARSTPTPSEPPFEENPYDYYHPDNENSIRCCTTRAFRYWVKPHLSAKMVDQDRELVSRRVKLILDQLVLGRNLFSETALEDGSVEQVAADIPNATIVTQELRLSADEQAAYDGREARAGTWVLDEMTPEKLKALEDGVGPKNNGSKFAKISVLCTHLGLSGLEKVSTMHFRKRRQEGLPMLTARMKAAGALNPTDLDKPLDSDVEVLRQFLWGSPKFKFALWEIQRIVLGGTRPTSHRKLLVFFQFPRSAEIFLKVR